MMMITRRRMVMAGGQADRGARTMNGVPIMMPARGLALRIRRRPIVAEPELRRRGGSRPVALEELLSRRDARRLAERGGP